MTTPLFSSIDMETTNFCNRKCVFCPKYKDERKDIELMPIETLISIVEQLKELKFKGRISFTNYGEPMSDKRLPEIAKLFRENFIKNNIDIHTNGDYIKSPEDIIKLLDSGISGIQINIYSENRREFVNKVIEDTKNIYGTERFFEKNNNIYDHNGEMKILYTIDRTNFDILKGHNKLVNRAGNIPWLKGFVYKNTMCANPFRKFTIRSNGEVSLCCEDYWNKISLGNVNNTKLIDIWESEKLKDIREKLIVGRRDLIPELCAKCDHVTYRNYKTKDSWEKFIDINEYRNTDDSSNKKYLSELGSEIILELGDDWLYHNSKEYCAIFKKEWKEKFPIRGNKKISAFHYEFFKNEIVFHIEDNKETNKLLRENLRKTKIIYLECFSNKRGNLYPKKYTINTNEKEEMIKLIKETYKFFDESLLNIKYK